MSIYFIDYENVNKNGLQGIEDMSESDDITIFYSDNADTMTFSLHEKINKSKASIHFLKVEVPTRNALDFQLVSYLGYMLASHPEDRFYIVSKDAGYQSVCQFWKSRQKKVELIGKMVAQEKKVDEVVPSVEQTMVEAEVYETKAQPVSQPKDEPVSKTSMDPVIIEKESLYQSVIELTKEEVAEEITDCLIRYKSKQEINNALVKKYGSTQGGEYYKKLKPLVSKMKLEVQQEQTKAKKTANESKKVKKQETQPLEKDESRKQVEAILGDKLADEINSLLLKYKTKQGFNNALVKKYGSKLGGEYYQQLRPLLSGKKGR